MKLLDLFNNYDFKLVKGTLDIEINGIKNDSRKIKEGDLFIAEKGYTVDGHDYISEAIKNGAKGVLLERDIQVLEDISLIRVQDTIDAMAYLSSTFFGCPHKKMKVVGITGTNGKTSTSYFIKSIFDENNFKSGLIGTINALVGHETILVDNTTPNSLIINEIMDKMVKVNTEYCLMEVSSHALELKRVNYIDFDIGLFTNLTKDHLDYHETMDNYFNSKAKLFNKTKKYNIINIDDPYGKKLIDLVPKNIPILTFGLDKGPDIYATDIEFSLSKVSFKLYTPLGTRDIILNIPGEFSVYNALAATSIAYAYDIDLDTIKRGLEKLPGVKGRFEVVPTDTDYTVIIDFAHTADGLEKVLTVIDGFAEGRKLVVFGAGGNRDKTKRPEMGETVAKHADLAILTSDNPRFEDPDAIAEDVLVGIKKANGNYVKIIDRKEAIKYALDEAKEKDIILIAGKGHETYIIINGHTYPFDEREIVLDYLASKK